MKKIILSFSLSILLLMAASAQDEFKPGGSATGTVFFNYRYSLNDVDQVGSFNLDRAYLGYKYDFSKTLSGKVLFDVAFDPSVKAFTAFAKNAQIDWVIMPSLKLTAGMFGLRQFDTQEKFYGYRYIMKTFVDEYKLGTSADMGINLEFPLNKKLTFNAFVINGEGYKSIQDNFGLHKVGANAIIKPVEGLTLKVHYDMMPTSYRIADSLPVRDTSTITGFSAFAGYEMKDKFRLGIEYNLMSNGKEYNKPADDHDLGGFSIYGTYIFSPKFELFGRYDFLKSNTISNESNEWNYSKDGSLAMAGLQYSPTKGVYMAINYRTWMFSNSSLDNQSWLYLNLGLSF